ncbi:hypothetical protein SLEP1_g53148 [Rubroshorea leprosula]|uniref:Retrotransposon gag domain-containing protein n=1 Tax=Rubroshorea leprosula TaxID=152421 RepID=A0AAV5M8M4_9ROSI|nr:hypothetical protein SLEP1_g53148 [Rubroshorea leprosula]
MSEENIVINPEKSTVDERVDKLEATMQTMAATLQTINITLSTLTTDSAPSPTSLVPAIPVPPVLIPSSTITPGNRAKDPMVTQLQFPPIYENQPLMGESSSHAPQISSLPFEASHPPLEMNNPTLPTTIPPLMGQVPTIQPNPLVEILRPTLKDGKSREIDHKLQQLEEALKAMQGPQAYGSIDLDDLFYYLGIQTNFKFKQPDFNKYDGSGCPYAHLQIYARKMAPYANDERVLIHYFQDSLSGPASIWFSILDKKKIRTFKDVSQAFMRQYEYNMSLAPTRDSLQRVTKKSNETFKEFAQRWRSEAAKVIPTLADSEICSLFIKSTTRTFRPWLAPCVGYTFAQLVTVGEEIEDGLKTMQAAAVRPPYLDWYDQQVRCEYHNVVGHDTEYCTTLKHRVQDLIDEGKLQLDTKETKGAPNITQNPLPPPDAPTMNMVAFDEVDRPVLENASSWSFDELFAILIEHDLIHTIASVRLDVPPMTIDDALVCFYHFNMKGHTLQNCGDFQRKIIELQRMGSLKFMSAPESEKFRASVMEEYFTKEKPYILQDTTKAQVISQPYVLKTSLSESLMGKTSSVVMPQRSTILNSKVNGVSNMTRNDDEIPDKGNGHTKAFHISVQCKMMNVPHVLIDNGSALNVIPMTVLKQLKVDESHINQCNTVVRAFNGTKKNVIGKIELPMEIGSITFDVDFFIMDISPACNMLLGRPWIHVAGAVSSTLHQKVKYIVNGVLVTVNGEEEHVIRKATTIPYLGVDPGTYESSYHSMECAATSYIHPRFRGKGLKWLNLPKLLLESCFHVIISWEKLKKEDWQRMRAIKKEKCLARLQGRDPRDEPMWVPHIRVTFSRPTEILCPFLNGYVFEEVVVKDITNEVSSDDEEDSFGFNNLFGLANMTDPKERWRRMLVERIFMENHPNFQLIHHAKAPMGSHESVPLKTVKVESLCDSWGNLTINALDEKKLEFDRGISLVNGSSQANWLAKLLLVAFISE